MKSYLVRFFLLTALTTGLAALGGCDLPKHKSPGLGDLLVQPSPVGPAPGVGITYPNNGPDLVAYTVAKYPERLVAGISREERIANMQFLRDRLIEAGKCGGMDLGWNLKRGGPEISVDFVVERRNGAEYGHDIGMAYDDASRPLQLYWGDGDFPFYAAYPATECQ
jgi:hypothetical protein